MYRGAWGNDFCRAASAGDTNACTGGGGAAEGMDCAKEARYCWYERRWVEEGGDSEEEGEESLLVVLGDCGVCCAVVVVAIPFRLGTDEVGEVDSSLVPFFGRDLVVVATTAAASGSNWRLEGTPSAKEDRYCK